MKRFIFLLVFALTATSLPFVAAADDTEMWEAQTWCFEPDILFYVFDPCMTVYSDGYSFMGMDIKTNDWDLLITILSGNRTSRQSIQLTMWQYLRVGNWLGYHQYVLRSLEFNLHLITGNAYQGTSAGQGVFWDSFTYETVDFEYHVTLTIDEDGNAEFQLSSMEGTQE